MLKFKLLLLAAFSFSLAACSNTSIQDYADEQPQLDIQEFFNGNIKAWGIVQNWRGKVVNRFVANMVGYWDGDTGILDEEFVYANGDTQFRQWRFEKVGENQFTGEADDVIGAGSIVQAGNAVNLNYRLIVPLEDGEIELNFDDWMWLVDDTTIINRAKMKKFGLTVGELTVVIQKITP